MARNRGRVGRGLAGRQARAWLAAAVACLLSATVPPAFARQDTAGTTTRPAAPGDYAECLRSYAGRLDAATYCRRAFPDTAPASTTSTAPASTTPTPYERCVQAAGRTAEAQKACAQRYPDSAPVASREPVDITPQINRLIEAWQNRPTTPRPSADPLAVVPGILAACAPLAADAERWRRCTADGWRRTGLRGQPPLVLQTPPTPPPPVYEPPPAPVRPEPPVQTRPVVPPPPEVRSPPPVVVAPTPPVSPPVVAAPPTVQPEPPVPAPPPAAAEPAPEPRPPSIPIWAWLVALAVAGLGGFGLAKLLGRARPQPAGSPASAGTAPAGTAPQIVLVADPGVVSLVPDGSPRAGMAVSLRFERAPDADEVRLDYPTLETAP